MATLVLKTATCTVNAVDLSDHVESITIDYSAEEQDDTYMGDTSRGRLAGLLDWSATVVFGQDYAASEVDATLFPLVGAASFTFACKPTNAAVSTTNPNFNGNAILTSYPPISGAVGDKASVSATFMGDGALARATS